KRRNHVRRLIVGGGCVTEDSTEEGFARSLADHIQAARWLTDRVQSNWRLMPKDVHNLFHQGDVRNLLRSYKAKALEASDIPKATLPLGELFSAAVAMGRAARAHMDRKGWTQFPAPLSMGIECVQASDALINLTALYLLASRDSRGWIEKAGDMVGATFALQSTGELFQAGLYIGYAGEDQDRLWTLAQELLGTQK